MPPGGPPAGVQIPGMPPGVQIPGMPPGVQIPGMPPGVQIPGMPPGVQIPGMPPGAQIPGMPPGAVTSSNPYVFMEVGPHAVTINSISAHVVSADGTPISTNTSTATTAGN